MAEALPVVGQPSNVWLDKLTPIEAIDPGESQIFAVAAEAGLVVVSDDKRALRALKGVADFADALAGRIVVIEAILLGLCNHLGPDSVRRRIQSLAEVDNMVRVCFSAGNPEPRDALLSYYRSLVAELDPLTLWEPGPGG